MSNLDRQLRYFLKIAEVKSLSRAADELDLSQSALSRQLAQLESELGKSVFSRTGRGVEFTEAGEKLYEGVATAFTEIDRHVDLIKSSQGVTEGTVRIATVHTLSYYFLSDLISGFVASHPGINFSLMCRSSPEVVSLVETGRADIGFVYDALVASRTLKILPLFDSEMCLILPESTEQSGYADLRNTPLTLVGFPPHYALRRMIHSSGLNVRFSAEAETVDAMLRLVQAGVGACILPSSIPDSMITHHALKKIRITDPILKRRVVAVTRIDRISMPVVDELMASAYQLTSGFG
jgi:DNA-binding transcriptional LysR family regulator